MVLSTRSSTANCFIVSLDVGSSSVRALLFDAGARQMEGYGAHLPYQEETTPDGGVEVNPDRLARLALDCLDELHRQVHAGGLRFVRCFSRRARARGRARARARIEKQRT